MPMAGDWAARIEAGVAAFESELGVRLEQAHTGTKRNASTTPVPDRPKFLKQRARTSRRWLSLFSGRGLRRTASGFENVDYFNFGGSAYEGGERYRVMLFLPPRAPAVHERLLVRVCDALEAESAQYTPPEVAARMRLAHWGIAAGGAFHPHVLADRSAGESRLPALCESAYAGLGPRQPHHFGWLNYWSEAVCAALGFPERAEGLGVLEHSYRTPRGAWLVKLGAEPFAPRDAAQVELLDAMYQRFPGVGVRFQPR